MDFKAVNLHQYAKKTNQTAREVVREVVLEAMKQDGYALRYASEELKKDREVVPVSYTHLTLPTNLRV